MTGSGGHGIIMGVLKKELTQNNLFITATRPDSKGSFKSLKSLTSEDEGKKEESNNEIGIYVSCELGLAFTHTNLVQMIVAYRNFRNSVMAVYDVNKSAYGLNPLLCFRLSQQAIAALNLNDPSNLTDKLVQDKILSSGLTMTSLFEEVDMKIHRSHLL